MIDSIINKVIDIVGGFIPDNKAKDKALAEIELKLQERNT